MKQLFAIFLLIPVFGVAQRFDNDTLYTSGGYRIYKGQVLNFASGTSAAGYFRTIKFHYSMNRTDTYIMGNSTVLVNKLRNFKASGDDNYNIRVTGTATLKDGRKAEVDFFLDFEKAITGTAGLPPELVVPPAYINKRPVAVTPPASITQPAPADPQTQNVPADLRKLLVADEIQKLFDLFKAGALTKEEYESQKKKLLERQ